jgi:hypothetical protein
MGAKPFSIRGIRGDRGLTISVRRSSGTIERCAFVFAVPLYRGVYTAGKADRYANCQHNSGTIELDGQRDDWTLLQDMPAPFVVSGLRRQPDH